jgi:hypothetical protein
VSKKLVISVIVALLVACPAWAEKKEQAKFKSVEVKRFVHSEGVELSPEFPDFLYAQLRKELQKTRLFQEIVGEGETVAAADAERSLVLTGSVLEYKKGSVAKQVLVGFGSGRRAMKTHVTLTHRNTKDALLDKDLVVKTPSTRDQKLLANFMAKKIANQIKNALAKKGA